MYHFSHLTVFLGYFKHLTWVFLQLSFCQRSDFHHSEPSCLNRLLTQQLSGFIGLEVVKVKVLVAQTSPTFITPWTAQQALLWSMNSPGKRMEWVNRLLQGISWPRGQPVCTAGSLYLPEPLKKLQWFGAPNWYQCWNDSSSFWCCCQPWLHVAITWTTPVPAQIWRCWLHWPACLSPRLV